MEKRRWRFATAALALTVLVASQGMVSAQLITEISATGNVSPVQHGGSLQEDALCYTDRTHDYNVVPISLLGAEYIMTGNDDKTSANYQLTFTLTSDAILYLILDNRLGDDTGGTDPASGTDDPPTLGGGVMDWVEAMGFVDTGLDIGIDESGDGSINQSSSLYSMNVTAGVHVLEAQNDPGGRNMYGVAAVVQSETPYLTKMYPLPDQVGLPPELTVEIEIEDSATMVDQGSIDLTFDGSPVTPVISKVGTTTTISYDVPGILDPLSEHTVGLAYQDDADPPFEYDSTWSFTVADYLTVLPEWGFPSNAAVTSAPGFLCWTAQAPFGSTLANSAARANAQLAGTLINPATGEPYEDVSLPGPNADGSYDVEEDINYNIDAGIVEQGNFHELNDPPYDDWEDYFPGIMDYEMFAAEFIAYLPLTAGTHTFGVNSDDGFLVTTGRNPRDLFAPVLGRFDGGRGSSDTLFSFVVEQAGVYPIRLLYYQGTGGGNLEFFYVDPETSDYVLINNPVYSSLQAYREVNGATPAFLRSTIPADGEQGVGTEDPIVIEIEDVETQVNQGSITLTLNDTPVTPTVSKVGNVTTVQYIPSPALEDVTEYVVEILFQDSAGNNLGGSFTFQTDREPLDGPAYQQNPDGLVVANAEDFHAVTPRGDHAWVFYSDFEGYTGDGFMAAMPNSGAGFSDYPDLLTTSPRLDYEVNFDAAGTYRIWVRGEADSGSDDSLHGGIDLDNPDTARRIDNSFSPNGQWHWVGNINGGAMTTIEVTSVGTHTVSFWVREDGFRFDKFLLTQDMTYVPTGEGPEPSRFVGEAPPPAVTITSPAEGQEFAGGEDITIEATATDENGTIELVEFFANGDKIGEATAAPFSVTWSGAASGYYALTAVATDNDQDSGVSPAVNIVVGEPNPRILFVVSTVPPINSDQMIADRLTAFGFDVVLVDDNVCQTSDADDKLAVIVSSSVGSGNVAGKYRDVTIPVMTWEQAIQDDMRMTTNEDTVTRGTTPNQGSVNIVDSSHPMAAGLANGAHPIEAVPGDLQTFSWGAPLASAQIVGTLVDDTGHACLYGYDTGAAMIDGFIAPARRVFVFLGDPTYQALNEDGVALIDAAFEWLLDMDLELPSGPVELNIDAVGGTVVLSWPIEGSAGLVLKGSPSLSSPNWTDVNEAVEEAGEWYTVTLDASEAMGFYMLVRP